MALTPVRRRAITGGREGAGEGYAMSMAVKFDTFQYAQILKEAGVPESQVAGHIKAQSFALQDSLPNVLATREDLVRQNLALSKDIAAVRADLSKDIAAVEAKLSREIAGVRVDVVGLGAKFDRFIWVAGGVGAMNVVILGILIKLFLHV